MSLEQANAFWKHRDAEDPQGNQTWIMRLQQKAVRVGPEAQARLNVEALFELTDDEKVLWRLLRLARKLTDLENTGVLPQEKLRGFLRGLVAADVLDIVELTEAKVLLPAEVKRTKAEVAGAPVVRKTEPLRGKVYRPDISKPAPAPVDVEPAFAPPVHTPAPVPDEAVALSEEEQLILEAIDRAWADMNKQNFYEFMGLTRPTDDVSVRQAYVRLAREYHPDRLAGGPLSHDKRLQGRIDSLFKRLGDAQVALQTAEARAGYDRTLEQLGPGGSATNAAGDKQRRPAEAANAFRMADTFLKRRDFKNAEAHFRQAALFDPEDPKILTALAWCVFSNPDTDDTNRTAEAKRRLSAVVHTHQHADAHYKLGLVLRKAGDEAGAQKHFGAAVKVDPSHTDATREVRLAGMRDKKGDKGGGGLFGKLLRK